LWKADFRGAAPGEREGFCSGGKDYAGVNVAVKEEGVAFGEQSFNFVSRRWVSLSVGGLN